jgi:hypothetical protein
VAEVGPRAIRGNVARITKRECELVANRILPLETQRISTCYGKATMLDRIDRRVGTSEILRMGCTERAMVRLAEASLARTPGAWASRRRRRGPVDRIDK